MKDNFKNRTIAEEKIWVDMGTKFHYLMRGVERTPQGSPVIIEQCNDGIQTLYGSVKKTIFFGLKNTNGQMIAFSHDIEDLQLFAMEHDWVLINLQ